MAKKKEPVLELPVTFGGVSFGAKTARISVTVERKFLKLAAADKNLCEQRLTGTIIARPPGDESDQPRLPGMEDDVEMNGLFDVKHFSVYTGAIKFGLTILLKDLDRDKFSNCAMRNGRLSVYAIDEIPEAEKKTPDEHEAKE